MGRIRQTGTMNGGFSGYWEKEVMARTRPAEEAVAYEAWAAMQERNVKKLADQTGMSADLLYDWKQRYKWDDRLLADQEADRGNVRRIAQIAINNHLGAAIGRLGQIVREGADKDAINAAKILLDHGLTHERSGDQPASPVTMNQLVVELKDVPTDQLLAHTAQALAGNLSAVEQSRLSKRHQVPRG